MSELKWLPISSAPIDQKEMFVVKAFNVNLGKIIYTSDPYCVWAEEGDFRRWPHSFMPTHWMQLPNNTEDS